MTIEEAAILFRAAAEEIRRHGAIDSRITKRLMEIQVYDHEDLEKVPGELMISERSSEHYPFIGSKEFTGIKFYCLYETDPRQQSEEECGLK